MNLAWGSLNKNDPFAQPILYSTYANAFFLLPVLDTILLPLEPDLQ
jgi:hypothetical protein